VRVIGRPREWTSRSADIGSCYELAARAHSITSSARARSEVGKSRLIALAVLRPDHQLVPGRCLYRQVCRARAGRKPDK
jgi:hypothetical protein